MPSTQRGSRDEVNDRLCIALNQQLPNAGKLQRCPFLRLESPPSNSCYNPRLWQNLPQTSLHDLLGLLPRLALEMEDR